MDQIRDQISKSNCGVTAFHMKYSNMLTNKKMILISQCLIISNGYRDYNPS